MSADPVLSVVIPVRNGEVTLRRCLDAVFAALVPGCEVIVVDDGSTDGTGAILTRYSVREIRHDRPRGAAAARNAGARLAAAPVVCFLDADVVVAEDTFRIVLESFEDPAVHGVVGMMGPETEHGNFASQYENLYMHYMYLTHAEEMDIFYTSLAAIQREVFLAVGGFDEHYVGAGIEDMELGQRLVREGYRLRLNRTLQVFHLKRFRWWSLLAVNRHKAAGTLRIMLRNRANGKHAGGQHVGPDWRFLSGIPATALAGLGLVGGVVFSVWFVALAALGLFALVALINARFLVFLGRMRGIRFLAVAIPFFFVQFVNYGAGLTRGLVGYLGGDRY